MPGRDTFSGCVSLTIEDADFAGSLARPATQEISSWGF
jgi:hypothetical protein